MPVLRWQDLLDILIVAFFSYRIMLFFIGTRAMQLIRGMLVLALAAAVTRALDLRTLSWLLTYLMGALIIAVPIVFQPEIRRFLEEVGRGRFLTGSKTRKLGEANIKAISEAVKYLSDHKIGALMVFQYDTGLKDIWRSATIMNANISKDLIVSIFWNGTPLHDGAMVIDRNQILAASCYLPLTDRKALDQWHGSRHRAAVGVTEHSDAATLVVSEEKGCVRLSRAGVISDELDAAEITKFLREYFTPRKTAEVPLLTRIRSALSNMGWL